MGTYSHLTNNHLVIRYLNERNKPNLKKNMKKLSLLSATMVTTLAAYTGAVNSVTATKVYADSNISVKDIIKTIKQDTNRLPVEKVEADGDSIADLTSILQQRRKAIARKIVEVNAHTTPVESEIGKYGEKTENTNENIKSDANATLKEQPKETEKEPTKEPETTKEPEVVQPPVDGIAFGDNGLLIEQPSGLAQSVVNGLLGIPGHSNGAYYHQNGLDSMINQLSTAEAIWVIHQIEGDGFGQTGDGMAGIESPASHRTFINNQVTKRFGGSVHALLRAWGTFSYGGY